MRRLLLAALLSLSGCATTTAELVSARGRSAYGPVNERPGGEVRYSLVDGDPTAERELAYQQMRAFCRGPYAIAREWNEDSGTVTRVDGLTGARTQQAITYRHVAFDCGSAPTGAGGSGPPEAAPPPPPPTP